MDATETLDHPGNNAKEVGATQPRPDPNWIPGTEIVKPSAAYARATEAYSFRVSELIFGSLLASYILGFIAVGTSLGHNSRPPLDLIPHIATSPKVHLIVQALCVSICFSYLTAALYLTYHKSILTMPHFQTSNLRWDFAIAILQAVLFGISEICLELFPVMTALSLFAVFFRQEKASKQLSDHFWRGLRAFRLQQERLQTEKKQEQFRTAIGEIQALNEDFQNCMNGWLPVSSKLWWGAILLLVCGLLNLTIRFGSMSQMPWFPPTWLTIIIQTIFYVILTWKIFWGASKVFQESHEMMKNPEGSGNKLIIDDVAELLVGKLRAILLSAQSKSSA